MLRAAFYLTAWIDRKLATPTQRMDAASRAQYAISLHGADAFAVLYRKLRDPRRRRSQRTIRLAIANLVEQSHRDDGGNLRRI